MTFAGDIAIYLSALACITFVLVYHFTSPWWRSEYGVHLMTFTAFCAAVMIYVTYITVTTDTTPSHPVTRLVIFGTFAAFIWWRVAIVIRGVLRVGSQRAKAAGRASR